MNEQRFAAIGIDADDTLWHNETLYQEAAEELAERLSPWLQADQVTARLLETETRNVAMYGYGIKSFVLSMIEVAISVFDQAVPTDLMQALLATGRRMIEAPVDLVAGARCAIEELAETHVLWLITKGDLLDQTSKLERSGLAPLFAHVDVVTDKTPAVYHGLLEARSVRPNRFAMVGNSPRSDIEPILSLGGTAILVPYHLLWAHEDSRDSAPAKGRMHTIPDLTHLPGLIATLEAERRDR